MFIKFAIFMTLLILIAGCSVSTKSSEEPIIKDTSAETETINYKAETKDTLAEKAEPPKSDLKPEDIDLDKPFEAAALRDAVFANPEAWKDKEVAVIGNYNGFSVSNIDNGKLTSLTLKSTDGKELIRCRNQGEAPENLSTSAKGAIFKGKIKPAGEGYDSMSLEPCEKVQTNNSKLKPDEIDLAKPFDPKEITDAVAENESAWKGKVITVRGKTGGGYNENPNGSLTFYIMNKENQTQMVCRGTKAPPKDAASKEYTYKGKIEKVSDGMRNKELRLIECGVAL